MRSVVVGATGMIGAHVARAILRRGGALRVTRRASSKTDNLEGLDAEIVEADLLDPASLARAFEGCDRVYQCAAYYPVKSFGDGDDLHKALAGTRNLIEAALGTGASRVVFVSSLTTIGHPPGRGRPANEDDRYNLNYRSPYFEIKHAMEGTFLEAVSRGLPGLVVNPTLCLGEYDIAPTTGKLVLAIAAGEMPFYVERPVNVIYTGDVGEICVTAAERGRPGERYILGAYNVMTGDLLRAIAEAVGAPAPKRAVPLWTAKVASMMSEAGAAISGGLPRYPYKAVEMLDYSQHFDVSKARRELSFSATPLDEAARRTADYYRRRGWLGARRAC